VLLDEIDARGDKIDRLATRVSELTANIPEAQPPVDPDTGEIGRGYPA
jgi:hypothetical protein